MQETEMQYALQSYVSDAEPAMGLTADGVLTAGRRSRRTRRLAGFAGAALAATLVGIGVVVVSSGTSTGADFAAAAPCPFPPGPRPPGVIAADQPLPPEVREWASTSVTCHLNDELPRLLPDARYARVPGAPAGPLLGFSHGGEPPFGNRIDAMALIHDAEGTGDLTVMVGVVDPSMAGQAVDECRRSTMGKCSVQSGPNGESVLLSTAADGMPAELPRDLVARVYRGHSEILVQVSNTDRQVVNGNAPVATRPEPVLSTDQAVQLALSPELYLFP
ncbi:hypothetical protein QLQ12_23785 [Actinoplanes sp. NEAU-A12]|uniref:Uncharacterized protein n=1 Tax=Actinoplanes sandaracinus TaxID=3045177 RepID=A0ABT6WPK8_9ACTN|nr:hypothetical protein [Actinoplanes sandaracinus]MDI6101647.1 hypothetical protein [Actinoplanes sandaracinus]